MFFFFFFFTTSKTSIGLSRSRLILLVTVLFAMLTATEAWITVENLHAESMEVTWDAMQAELQAKASFCVQGLDQGGFHIFFQLLCPQERQVSSLTFSNVLEIDLTPLHVLFL